MIPSLNIFLIKKYFLQFKNINYQYCKIDLMFKKKAFLQFKDE